MELLTSDMQLDGVGSWSGVGDFRQLDGVGSWSGVGNFRLLDGVGECPSS